MILVNVRWWDGYLESFECSHVRWWDGYLESFECSHVRQGGYILWLRLVNGENRTIPLIGNVRWFSTDPESHAYKKGDKGEIN